MSWTASIPWLPCVPPIAGSGRWPPRRPWWSAPPAARRPASPAPTSPPRRPPPPPPPAPSAWWRRLRCPPPGRPAPPWRDSHLPSDRRRLRRPVPARGGISGRNVRVVFRDDQYNPSRAVAVCREMVEEEHAFLLVGVGTDQVVSCARYASQAGVPYFSMGGGEAAVAGIRNYFGIS